MVSHINQTDLVRKLLSASRGLSLRLSISPLDNPETWFHRPCPLHSDRESINDSRWPPSLNRPSLVLVQSRWYPISKDWLLYAYNTKVCMTGESCWTSNMDSSDLPYSTYGISSDSLVSDGWGGPLWRLKIEMSDHESDCSRTRN